MSQTRRLPIYNNPDYTTEEKHDMLITKIRRLSATSRETTIYVSLEFQNNPDYYENLDIMMHLVMKLDAISRKREPSFACDILFNIIISLYRIPYRHTDTKIFVYKVMMHKLSGENSLADRDTIDPDLKFDNWYLRWRFLSSEDVSAFQTLQKKFKKI